MEPFSIWLKFYTKTNLSARNPLKIVPMVDFQGKSPCEEPDIKNVAILDLAKILHLDLFECGESLPCKSAIGTIFNGFHALKFVLV